MDSTENQVNIKSSINEDDEACMHALTSANSIVFPMLLNAAVELDLFEIVARAGCSISPTEIASQLSTQDPNTASRLDRILRLLASHSLLTCSIQTLEDGRDERLYGLTPTSHFFLKTQDGSLSVAPMSSYSSHRAINEVWLHFKDGILEGGNQFKKVHGVTVFEYMEEDPEFNKLFNAGMAGVSTICMRKVMEMYQGFEGLGSLVDVAGGTGKCLNIIVSKYPSIKGINFDLPHVTQTAPSYPGDMFLSIPKADAIMINNTLHNWSDDHCVKVLKNCYEALPDHGKLIVMGVVLPELPDSSFSSLYATRLDNIMLMLFGGQERTGKEFQVLCKGSGFSNFQLFSSPSSPWAVMEFSK